jgi:hypothetical protein
MTEKDPMTVAAKDSGTAVLETVSSPARAAGQVDDSGWPKPGDEGYVHPDGTPQSVAQLAGNRQAALDRAAVGSIVHGAPAVQRGGRPDATNIAVDRARGLNDPTGVERDQALTDFVRAGQDDLTARVAEAAAADSGAEPVDPAETVTPTAGPGGAPLEDKPAGGKAAGKSGARA